MTKFGGITLLLLLGLGQTPAWADPVPDPGQAALCALAQKLRSDGAAALPASRSAIEAFVVQHRSIDWTGTAGRVVVSEKNKAGGEVEVCPSVWVGGVSPEGALDSDTWAEPDTRIYNRWRALAQGKPVEFRAALLGVYDQHPDFPAKIWLRARVVDVSPQP